MAANLPSKTTIGPEPGPLTRLKSSVLIFVRGPFFLSVISLVLLLITIPAQATLLKGYLTEDAAGASAGGKADVSLAVQHENSTEALAPNELPPGLAPGQARAASLPPGLAGVGVSDSQDDMESRASGLQKALLTVDSFPQSFAGAWRCVTVVVNSSVNFIPVGQRVQSQVAFVKRKDGKVVAHWDQAGWTESNVNITPVSEQEASLERTNYLLKHGAQSNWAARSRDHYLKLDADRIAAESSIDQYMDGQLLGQYQTRSMLYRLQGDVAYAQR